MKNKTLVLLHGWGCDSSLWSPVLPQLQQFAEVIALDLPGFGSSPVLEDFSAAVVDTLAAQLPDACVLLGWSLGGMLAVQLAARYPEKITQVITLASNAKFVAAEDYPSAMPLATNRQFNAGFAAEPEATRKLFSGLLIQGDSQERALLKKIRPAMAAIAITDNWAQALQLLAALDNRAAFASLQQPGLHLLGEADVLVPVAAANALTALNNSQDIQILPQAAHALHWSQPEKVVQLIADFLQRPVAQEQHVKHRIAKSFSRAAHSYDAVANLQRCVGGQLLSDIAQDKTAQIVMDLGCGTGYFAQPLRERFPAAKILAVDLAEGMLQFARARNSFALDCVCGDAEYLPLADASVDVIFSSLALQWCNNLPQLFAELQRVLKPGGKLFFSTLGPDTLHELKTAWQQVDSYVHVNRFTSREQLLQTLQASGLSLDNFTRQLSVLQFEKLVDLTRELKALGAHNVNSGQPEGLTGRKKIAAFKAAYEQFRHNHYLPASYDIFYVAARKASSHNG
ncbi:MAG TPA: malonyl-ACP O-methyltransferase BioC [Cellvibrio sp.]|nr:malonyl-ACP O-methyltransferase BioC [Cellvibrio sp.]